MTLNTEILQKLTTPKHRKGATEEHIYADNQKARKLAKLMAEVLPRQSDSQEGQGR